MYKLIKDSIENKYTGIINLLNGNNIPFDPANTDYQAYLAWLEAGNTPDPADE